jgi:hypothetical protein
MISTRELLAVVSVSASADGPTAPLPSRGFPER